jgi:hypothetical protein
MDMYLHMATKILQDIELNLSSRRWSRPQSQSHRHHRHHHHHRK